MTVTVKSPGGSFDSRPVGAIDLRLEEEVGREALRDVRVDAIQAVAGSRNPAIVGRPFSSCTRTRTGCDGADVKTTSMSLLKPMSCDPCPTLNAIIAER